MKTTCVYEVGDKVVVEGTREYGICSNNAQGGTESMPVGKPFLAKVVKEWRDEEIGQRYVAETEDGRRIFFGEFDVKLELARV